MPAESKRQAGRVAALQFFLLLLLTSSSLVSLAWGCTINLSTDVPNFSPVYFTAAPWLYPQYELFKPAGQVTTLPVGARLLLICSGPSSNVITALNVKSLELVCNSNNVFQSLDDGLSYNLNQLECSSIPTSSLKLTSQPCANNKGFVFQSGFESAPNKFAPLFDICYDNVTEHTFYTRNVINGKSINFSIQESTRRAFSATGMKLTTTATNTLYTINNQIARFEQFFGPSQPYITSTSYMARGHLTPDADMIFAYEQLATYYYTNAAPEFQVVNSGNWIRVENLARSLAASYNDDLLIYNGIYGDLQLPDPALASRLVTITLDSANKIRAPQYYFKVIKHVASDSAIVMITLNNPFATPKDVKPFCMNVCLNANVADSYFSDLSRGYTFCCNVNEFKLHYPDLPVDALASKLLIRF